MIQEYATAYREQWRRVGLIAAALCAALFVALAFIAFGMIEGWIALAGVCVNVWFLVTKVHRTRQRRAVVSEDGIMAIDWRGRTDALAWDRCESLTVHDRFLGLPRHLVNISVTGAEKPIRLGSFTQAVAVELKAVIRRDAQLVRESKTLMGSRYEQA